MKGKEWWLVQSPLVDDVGGEVEVGRAGDPVLVLVLQLRQRRHWGNELKWGGDVMRCGASSLRCARFE